MIPAQGFPGLKIPRKPEVAFFPLRAILRLTQAADGCVWPLRALENPLDPTGAQFESSLEGPGGPTQSLDCKRVDNVAPCVLCFLDLLFVIYYEFLLEHWKSGG